MAAGSQALRIGEVARAAGVNIQTLRYYERRRLVRPAHRELNGYRRYDAESVRVVRFIKHAQRLGFTLREIQALLRLRDTRQIPCDQVRARAEAKIAEIAAKERQLAAMRQALETLVSSCRRDGSRRECPILDALAAEEKGAAIATRQRRRTA
jgi:MerR family copper efflux transcriptional regulator